MLDYTIEKLPGGRAVFRLSGRLDANTATTLKDALKSAAADYATHLVIDLADLGFIDSSGLSTLVSGFKAVREKNGGLALTNVGPQVKVALELTRLDQIIPIYADIASALTSFDM